MLFQVHDAKHLHNLCTQIQGMNCAYRILWWCCCYAAVCMLAICLIYLISSARTFRFNIIYKLTKLVHVQNICIQSSNICWTAKMESFFPLLPHLPVTFTVMLLELETSPLLIHELLLLQIPNDVVFIFATVIALSFLYANSWTPRSCAFWFVNLSH